MGLISMIALQSPGNIVSIQFLRFIAALLVVLFHSVQTLGRFLQYDWPPTIRYVAEFGASGVHIFFVISGFIMIYTAFGRPGHDYSPSTFLARRFIRIYPIYWVYAGVYILAYKLMRDLDLVSAQTALGAFALYPGYSSIIIGPGWTLSFEVYFYVCFAIAMMAGLRVGLTALTLFFLASIAARGFTDPGNPVLQMITNSLLIEFLFGAWIATVTLVHAKTSARTAYVMISLSVLAFAAGIVVGHHRLPSVIMWGVPSAVLVAGFVFLERSGRLPALVRKASFLGDSSYSLYLLHVMLLDLVLTLTAYLYPPFARVVAEGSAAGALLVCAALALVCVAAAHVFYITIERRLVISLQDALRRRLRATPSAETIR